MTSRETIDACKDSVAVFRPCYTEKTPEDMIKTILLVPLLILLVPYLIVPRVNAQNSSSEHFAIENGSAVIESASEQGGGKVEEILGKIDATLFQLRGSIVHTGSHDELAHTAFTISVYPPSLDYGHIRTNQFINQDMHITVEGGPKLGYQLFLAQDHPLRSANAAIIPGTTCDTPSRPCTPSYASEWINKSTYGSGYHLTSLFADADFAPATSYRPFSNWNQKEPFIRIVDAPATAISLPVVVSMRVNTPSDQADGMYKHTIRLRAVPRI